MRLIVAAMLLGHVAVVPAAGAELSPPPEALVVPFLAQSEELCGGAAVAMVFRYWGDRHAGVEQFEPLVDRKAGGITGSVLVKAITERGWNALRIPGSIEGLHEQLGLGRPIIILVEDRPGRYHYLVVIGIDANGVEVHDPSWGPSRRISSSDLIRTWRPSGFWSVVVLPADVAKGSTDSQPPDTSASRAIAPDPPRTPCDSKLDDAVALIHSRGLGAADAAIASVRAECPEAAGPIRELAGVRFAERRWRDAEALAAQALARDSRDSHAWELLGASRFVQNDLSGSLDAWNQVGKPRIDLVKIVGLQHARYALIAQFLDLPPNALLTPGRFARASRRLVDLPDRTSSRIAYRPAPDGFAEVDVAIAERQWLPMGTLAWSATGAKAIVNREAEISVPGFAGQGEIWTVGWRWWQNRPRLAVSLATPRAGWLPGVLRVDLSLESQQYGLAQPPVPDGERAVLTETRTHGAVSIGDWITPRIRYRATAEIDEWNESHRTVGIGVEVERRSSDDRLSVTTAVGSYIATRGTSPFQTAAIHAAATTSTEAAGWVVLARAGAAAVTDAAPPALWPGAGTGHARDTLLRAHPLLDDGVMTGPAFGRTLVHAGLELERWLVRDSPVRVAIAGFADMARATRRLTATAGAPDQMDVGMGIRIRLPAAGTLRADVGRGLRDGATAVSVGWRK